jgi:hypothetical protein
MLLHHLERNESSVEPSTANNQEYCGDKLVAVSIIFMIFNTVIVILRCYARSLTKATYGWDDYLVFASFVSNIGLCVVSIRTHNYFIIFLVLIRFTWRAN